MLIGRPPFQGSNGRGEDAVEIMHRIKRGDFHISGSEWDRVSNEAKKLIQGNYRVYFLND